MTISNTYEPIKPISDLKGKIKQNWTIVSPEALGINENDDFSYFSAVCYFYGLTLLKSLNVPIGLISDSWQATSAEVWSPPDVISKVLYTLN